MARLCLSFVRQQPAARLTQDVLPPSIHPNGHAYTWQGRGDWRALPALPDALLTIWQQLLDEPRAPAAAGITPATLDEIKSALFSIDPDCPREVWINVMFGLEDACRNAGQPDVGYQLFDQWSSTSKKGKYPGSERNAQAVEVRQAEWWGNSRHAVRRCVRIGMEAPGPRRDRDVPASTAAGALRGSPGNDVPSSQAARL